MMLLGDQFCNHIATCVAELSATHSASDVDSATTAFFLLCQLTVPPVIINDFQLLNGGLQCHWPNQHLSSQSTCFFVISGT